MKFYVANIILALLNSYVVFRLTKYLPMYKHKFSFLIIIIGLVAFQNIGFNHKSKWLAGIEHIANSEKSIALIYQASYLLFGIITCLFLYTLVVDILNVILKISVSQNSHLYIFFDKFHLTIIILSTLITIILGIVEVVKGPNVERIEVFIKGLPNNFNNFNIVQVSDLHVGRIIKHDYVLDVVNITNSLNPDLIALTGDFVDGSVQELKSDVIPLSQLKSRHGTFLVTGNHEYYSGAEQWIQEFTNLGIKVLSNEHVLINNKNDQIVLAGVTDYSTIHNLSPNASSPKKALTGAPRNLVKILLAHQPASHIEAHKAGYNLQLSGHTHAGQYFPFTLLIRFFHRYYRGLNYHEGMWIYINRGTGYWGPPLRLGAPPEITLIVLKSA
jgi:predicted MPP superfamily phosphohydrolase